MSRKQSKPTVIGIDIGKKTFHLIGLDGAGEMVMRCKLSRRKLAERLVNLALCLPFISSGVHQERRPVRRHW